MDELFGVTELVQNKIDTEQGLTNTETNKATEAHVEQVNR